LLLPLILPGRLLVVRVRRLKSGLRRDDIELNGRPRRWPQIDAVEEVIHVPVRMQRLDLRCVQEPRTQRPIDGKEIPDLVVAVPDAE